MAEPPRDGLPDRVRFFYIKGQFFRVIHADGAIGSITPRGLIHFSLFSERPAIPQTMDQRISEDGVVGEQLDVVTKVGIVRELDVDVVMTKDSATQLKEWLEEKIKELETAERAAAGRK